jgi:hypothetical protein
MNLKRVINLELSKDEKGDLLADPNKILNRWMNYFCQVFWLAGGGVVLGRQKYRQQNHLCQSRAFLRLRLPLET